MINLINFSKNKHKKWINFPNFNNIGKMTLKRNLMLICVLFFFFEFGSWFMELDPTILTTFFLVNKFLKYWEISKNLCFQFFRYGLPNIFVLILSYNFFLFIRKKILNLKEIKFQMIKQTKNPTVDYYRNRMYIMKTTLLMIIGFLFCFGVLSFCLFSESLVMEIILFFNIAVIMTSLLEINSNENANKLSKNANFFINFTMIFLSTFVINDLFYWITGIKVFL